MAGHTAAAVAVVRSDAALYFSYRMAILTQSISLIAGVTLFYYLSRLVTVASFGSPDRYFQFVVIGLVIMQTILGTMGERDSPNWLVARRVFAGAAPPQPVPIRMAQAPSTSVQSAV